MRDQKSLFVAVFVCISATASPSFFNYEVAGIPKLNSDCTEAGKVLAARFVKITAVIPTGVKSSQESSGTCMVKVTYAAENPLAVVTTAPKNPFSGEGSYESSATCESALNERTNQFEKMTGLTSVVSYCQRANRETNRPYLARIESFGRPKVPLQYSDHVVDFGRAFLNAAEVESQLSKNFARYGISLSEVALRGSPSGGWFNYLAFSYYSNQPRTFEVLRPFSYTTPAGCEAAATDVPSFFNKAGAPLFGSFCTSQYGKHSINLLIEKPLSFSITTPPGQETYDSQAACESDRNRVENAYAKIGWNVFGTLCGAANDRFEMIVLGRGSRMAVEGGLSRRPLPWTEIVNAARTSFSEGSARNLAESDIRAGVVQKKGACTSDKGKFSSYGGFVSCSKLGSQYTCRGTATCACNKRPDETDESPMEEEAT